MHPDVSNIPMTLQTKKFKTLMYYPSADRYKIKIPIGKVMYISCKTYYLSFFHPTLMTKRYYVTSSLCVWKWGIIGIYHIIMSRTWKFGHYT